MLLNIYDRILFSCIRAEYMLRFLERFHGKYGTIHDFLMNELDMTMPQIHAVRDALVVKIPVPQASL